MTARVPLDELTSRFRGVGDLGECTCCDCTNRRFDAALDALDDALLVHEDEGEEPVAVAVGLLEAFARKNDLDPLELYGLLSDELAAILNRADEERQAEDATDHRPTPEVDEYNRLDDERVARIRAGTDQPGDRDACAQCGGEKGGVPGNENVVEGVVLCDYCHAARDRDSFADAAAEESFAAAQDDRDERESDDAEALGDAQEAAEDAAFRAAWEAEESSGGRGGGS